MKKSSFFLEDDQLYFTYGIPVKVEFYGLSKVKLKSPKSKKGRKRIYSLESLIYRD